MLRIITIENDDICLTKIEDILYAVKKDFALSLAVCAYSEINEYIQSVDISSTHDIYILELEYKGDKRKGIELAKKIRKQDPYCEIIFLTRHIDLRRDVQMAHIKALDYISKHLPEDEIKKRIIACVLSVVEKYDFSDDNKVFSYSYRDRKGIHLPYREILYIETTQDSHLLKLIGLNITEYFYGAISGILAEDINEVFHQIHRSTIVNVSNVVSINKRTQEVIFRDGTCRDGSRSGIKSLIKRVEGNGDIKII